MPPKNTKKQSKAPARLSDYQKSQPEAPRVRLAELEIVANPYPDRDYLIHFEIPEFNCVCPKTGQPDFATLYIDYVPGKWVVELKALKLYITSFRNIGMFHEAVTNRVMDDIVKACKPKKLKIKSDFSVRGGIHTIIESNYKWKS